MRNQVVRLQFPFRLVPLVDPVDHAEQSKGSGARAHRALRRPGALSFFLNIGDQALHEVDVLLLALVDSLAERGRQRMVFI